MAVYQAERNRCLALLMSAYRSSVYQENRQKKTRHEGGLEVERCGSVKM
jgi:hypothetical protein